MEELASRHRRILGILLVAAWLASVPIVLADDTVGPDRLVEAREADESERLKALSLEHWIARSNRLQRIAQPLQVAGVEICGRSISPILGAGIIDIEQLPDALQPLARTRFGKKGRFFVTEVFEGMAAHRGGLAVGDAVLELNGKALRFESQFYGFKRMQGQSNRLRVRRAGAPVELELETDYGCRYPAQLATDTAAAWNTHNYVNAYADGDSIRTTHAFMRYFEDDDMVAQTLGHELGHNIFRSPGSTRRGGWASRRAEARCDYVGFYLAAIAGYELEEEKYQRLQKLRGIKGYSAKSTHPSTPERTLAARRTIDEIEAKRRRGEPLKLNFE